MNGDGIAPEVPTLNSEEYLRINPAWMLEKLLSMEG